MPGEIIVVERRERNGDWKIVRMRELKEHDIFRTTETNDSRENKLWTATSEPYQVTAAGIISGSGEYWVIKAAEFH